MENSMKQIERLGDLLVEGGMRLCGLICAQEAEDLFDGEVPREAAQISKDLMLISTILKTCGKVNEVFHEIALEAGEALDDYELSSISRLLLIRGGGGSVPDIITTYVYISRRYRYWTIRSYATVTVEFAHQLRYITLIILYLESYGTREDWNSLYRRKLYDTWEGEMMFVVSESDVEMLVEHLVTNNEIRVFAIWGLVGIANGSTARNILKHPNVLGHFSATVSITVHNKSVIEIQREIMANLLPADRQTVDVPDEFITEVLIQLQQKQKCLVVLDDFLCFDEWEYLKNAFPIQLGTKFLVPTNNKDKFDKGALIHHKCCLNKEESWELFKHRVNEWNILHSRLPQKDMMEVENIGRNITSRCQGHPFLIITLAQLLSSKLKLSQWKILHKILDSYTLVDDLDLGYGTLSDYVRTNEYILSSEERSCLRYLSNIAQDYQIDTEKLYLLWSAEGLISMSDDQRQGTRESPQIVLAEYCLRKFERLNIVQMQVDESTGRTKYCRVLDISKGLSFLKSNLNIFHVEGHPKTTSPYHSSVDIVRNRLVICLRDHRDLENYVRPKRKIAENLISELFLFQNYSHRSKISVSVQSHINDLKFVGVLDLGGLVFSKLDRVIGKLVHLKYLGLRYTVFHELPSTIANMKDLQTLDLWDNDTQYASVTIPNVLWKLKQLKHLYLRTLVWSNKEKNKLRCDNMSQMELFENFDSRVFNVQDLFTLTKLHRLRATICKTLDLERITEYLQDDASSNLQNFSLSIKYCDLFSEEGQRLLKKVFNCSKLHELSINGRTGELPMFESTFSQCLIKITLEGCELKDDPMITLEKLENLRSLYVKWKSFAGKEMVCSATGFPQLRILQLHRIRNLEKWRVEKGALPKLSFLEIMSCPALDMIPDGLQFVIHLKEVVIGLMPESFTSRLRVHEDGKDGDDLKKVEHASISIFYFDGKEETVKKNTDAAWMTESSADSSTDNDVNNNKDATIRARAVISKAGVSSSRAISGNKTTSNNRKGKAQMTESYSESSTDNDDEDEFIFPDETNNIWQLGFSHFTYLSK